MGTIQVTPVIETLRRSLFGPRMGLIVDMYHLLDRKLSVALRGRKALVAEHLLNRAQVRALFQHVSSERMPQGVWMHIRRQAFGHRDLLDDPAHAAGGEPAAAKVDQQGRRIFITFR